MVQISGTYQFVENVNATEYAKALGINLNERQLVALNDTNLKVIVKLDGDKCSITSSLSSVNFTFGQQFEDITPFGIKLQTIAIKEGEDKIVMSSDGSQKSGKRIYEFTDTGMTLTLTLNDSDVTAKRIYKRV